MFNDRIARMSFLCAVAIVATACSPEVQPSKSDESQHALWTPSSLAMGEGIDLTRDPSVSPGTQNICVEGVKETKRRDKTFATVFYSYDEEDIERTIDATLGLEGTVEGVDFDITAALDKYERTEEYIGEVLVIGANVHQVEEVWKANAEPQTVAACDGSQVRTFDEFISDCGTHFPNSRDKTTSSTSTLKACRTDINYSIRMHLAPAMQITSSV